MSLFKVIYLKKFSYDPEQMADYFVIFADFQNIGITVTVISDTIVEDAAGYQYTYQRSNLIGDKVWRCRKRGKDCKARIQTRNNFIIKKPSVPHNHTPDPYYFLLK